MWYPGVNPEIFFKEIKFLLIPLTEQYKFTTCFPGGASGKEPDRFDSWIGRSPGGE